MSKNSVEIIHEKIPLRCGEVSAPRFQRNAAANRGNLEFHVEIHVPNHVGMNLQGHF